MKLENQKYEKKQASYFEINCISTMLNNWPFISFLDCFVVTDYDYKKYLNKANNKINKLPGGCRKVNMQKSSVQVTVCF